MRRHRMGLIQTPDQLRFSYQAIIEGAKQLSQPPIGDNEVKPMKSMNQLIWLYWLTFVVRKCILV